MSINNTDEYYMRCALELSANGTECSPNPRVGCVITRGGSIIGKGWHKKCGGPHAEVEAVRDAGGDIEGADVYVTLEPCSHYGKTPPCADMLVSLRPGRVISSISDPNPKVAGQGFEKLRNAGIEVKTGVLEEECRWINRGFLRRMKEGRPWTMIKCAASLDGMVALKNGKSKWITGPEARTCVHGLRAENDALLTGVGTVLADDPEMTVRYAAGRSPLRVVLDRTLRTPPKAAILKGGAVIFTLPSASSEKAAVLEDSGARIVRVSGDNFLGDVLKELCGMGVNYLMIEAGPSVTSSFISGGLCDELALFVAPKIMGNGRSFAGGAEFQEMEDIPRLKDVKYTKYGRDLLIRGLFECSPDL